MSQSLDDSRGGLGLEVMRVKSSFSEYETVRAFKKEGCGGEGRLGISDLEDGGAKSKDLSEKSSVKILNSLKLMSGFEKCEH